MTAIPKSPTAKAAIAGGKETLRPEQQAPQGVDPDSAVDEKLRRSRQHRPGGLNPNTIVRN